MLSLGSRTNRTCPICLTSLTRPRPNTDSCSFAPFVPFRGLKISIEFLFFSSYEALQSTHERERTNNSAFLCVGFLIASASTIRLSADRIRKPADRIRKLTKRIRKIFIKSSRKNAKSLKISTSRKISPDFSCLQNQKYYENFSRKRRGELFSIFQKKAYCQF